MTKIPKSRSLKTALTVSLALSLVISPCVARSQVAQNQPQGTQTQRLPYAADPANVPEAIAKVQSGDFAGVHVAMIAEFHAVEAIPALKEQFNRKQDGLTKAQIASALVRLDEKDDTYWNFLVDYATKALDADPPAPLEYDPQGRVVPEGARGPAPEVEQWAKDHHVPIANVGEELFFRIPGAIMLLALPGDARAIPILRRALTSRDSMVQVSGAMGLAQVKDSASVPLIIAACEKAPRDSAETIARALVYFDDPVAQKAVDKFVPKETAQIEREKRAQGKGPFK